MMENVTLADLPLPQHQVAPIPSDGCGDRFTAVGGAPKRQHLPPLRRPPESAVGAAAW